MSRRRRIGLALGAGGARGIAHIGVLRVFEHASIPIDLIAGTSIGALVGGAFACGLDTQALQARLAQFLESPIYQDSALKSIKQYAADQELNLAQKIQAFFKNRLMLAHAVFRPGMLQDENFQTMIDYFIPDIDVADTQIPFRAVATDLVSGQAVIFSSGSLREAVIASCSVPGAVPPHRGDGVLLSDGGIVYMVPTPVVRQEGVKHVVAVSVNRNVPAADSFSSAVDVYVRATNIGVYCNEQLLLKDADVVLRPSLGDLHWTDFAMADALIAEGERCARANLHQLRKLLPLRRRWFAKKASRYALPAVADEAA